MDGFSDPMVDCKETKLRYRADQLFCAPITLKSNSETVGFVCVQEANDNDMVKAAKKQAKKVLKEAGFKGEEIEAFAFKDLTEVTEEEMEKIPSPGSGKPTLTMPRDFNLMFQTNVGAMSDASSVAYLRPETAQGCVTLDTSSEVILRVALNSLSNKHTSKPGNHTYFDYISIQNFHQF